MPLDSPDVRPQIARARDLLAPPIGRVSNAWTGLGAAAFAAATAVVMAGVMVLGPGVALQP